METLAGTLLQPQSPSQCDVVPGATVTFGDDGTIASVETGSATPDNGCWILPGFIDAHLHLPQWDGRGIDGLSLAEWQEQIAYPAETRMRDADLAERLAETFVTGMIANGTTTIAAFGSPFPEATDRAFSVFEKRGLRAVHGMMLNDMNFDPALSSSAELALEQSRQLAETWNGRSNGRLRYAICPRMAAYCSEALLRGVATLAASTGSYVLTHIAESDAEEAAVRNAHPEMLDDVELFIETGLLTRRTLLGHGVCLTESLRRQIAERNAAIVHCPTANLFLECGMMDYVAERRANIPVALGSSVAAGPEPFMPQVAVACLQTAKAMKASSIPRGTHDVPQPAEGWWLLTRGAAEVLDMGDCVGAIEPGYQADCLVVRPEAWINELPQEQQVSALLYTLRPEHIEQVYIDGRRVDT